MFVSSIFSVDKISKISLNVIISFVDIPCFHYVTRFIYIWKEIIAKTTTSDCGLSRNGSHKWSENSNLHGCFGLTVTNNFLLVWNTIWKSRTLMYIQI